jgi:hypothetical protein
MHACTFQTLTRTRQVPWYDDRRSAAQAALNATGPDRVNPDTLLAVLSTKPVLNQMTTYSIVAQPKTADVFTHFVRYCALQAAAAPACLPHLTLSALSHALCPISRCLPYQVTTPAPPEDYRPLVAYIRPLATIFTAFNACFVWLLCKIQSSRFSEILGTCTLQIVSCRCFAPQFSLTKHFPAVE